MKRHIVILAAGNASRYGEAKQLAQVNGVSMVNKMVDVAEGVENSSVNLVLGAYKQVIRNQLVSSPHLIINDKWRHGLAFSIVESVKELKDDASHLMFVLADQIALNSQSLAALWQLSEANPDSIVCAQYRNIEGPPVIFPMAFYNELTQLKGDAGAKSLLIKYRENIRSIDLPAASVDIDTKHDLEAWNRHQDQSGVN